MKARRVDVNQHHIVAVLRQLGFTVALTHRLGGGFPDLCVSRDNCTKLIEVKNGALPPSARRLTPMELAFINEWQDRVPIISTVDEAIDFSKEFSQFTRR